MSELKINSDPYAPVGGEGWTLAGTCPHCEGLCYRHYAQADSGEVRCSECGEWSRPGTTRKRAYRQDGAAMSATLPAVRCSEAMLARVTARAEATGTSPSDLIRTAVMEWLDL